MRSIESIGGEGGVDDAQAPIHFVARQPILAANERVIGYELLYRSGTENHFSCSDPSGATRAVIDTSKTLGLDMLCDEGLAFINCTSDVLLERSILSCLPRRR